MLSPLVKGTIFCAFNQVQEYIKAGDCYQINLTQEFKATAQGTLLSKAEQLWQLTHAPYAGYLKIDDLSYSVVHLSYLSNFSMRENQDPTN